MLKEGAGKVPPSPINIAILPQELRLLRDIAIERDKFRSYSSGSTAWKRGMTGPLSGELADAIGGPLPSSAVPIMIGLAGEWATAIYSGASGIDAVNRPGGDKDTDIEIHGLKIQVKTRRYSPRDNLVRCRRENGSTVEIHSHVFVFSQWNFGGTATLLGCLGTNDVRDCRVERMPAGHCNYIIDDSDLDPMARLRTEIENRK